MRFCIIYNTTEYKNIYWFCNYLQYHSIQIYSSTGVRFVIYTWYCRKVCLYLYTTYGIMRCIQYSVVKYSIV